MQHSEQIDQIAGALSLAQASLRNPKKSVKTDDNWMSAPLGKFFNASKRPFSTNGLSFSQSVAVNNSSKTVTASTLLMHSSGQWLSDSVEISYEKNTPEDRGLAIYIAKKTSFQAVTGMIGEDEVEKVPAAKPYDSQFKTAEDRRAAKNQLLEDLKLVTDAEELADYKLLHQDTIDKLTAEDPTYVSDVLRTIKLLQETFAKDGDSLEGKI